MTRRTWRIWHHWLSVIGGLFLLSYTATGLWHIPARYVPWRNPPLQPSAPPALETGLVTLDVSEVLTRAVTDAEEGMVLRSVTLQQIGSRAVYDVGTNRGRRLLDAQTGEEFSVSVGEAEQIVRDRFRLGEGVTLEHERVTEHTSRYLNGGLPAHLFHVAGESGTVYSVVEADGTPGGTTVGYRVNRWIAGLHALRPVRDLTGSQPAQYLATILTTILCLLLVGTGFFLIFPLPWKRRFKRFGEQSASEG